MSPTILRRIFHSKSEIIYLRKKNRSVFKEARIRSNAFAVKALPLIDNKEFILLDEIRFFFTFGHNISIKDLIFTCVVVLFFLVVSFLYLFVFLILNKKIQIIL